MLFHLGNITFVVGCYPYQLTATPVTTCTHSTACHSSSKIWLVSNSMQWTQPAGYVQQSLLGGRVSPCFNVVVELCLSLIVTRAIIMPYRSTPMISVHLVSYSHWPNFFGLVCMDIDRLTDSMSVPALSSVLPTAVEETGYITMTSPQHK